MIFSPSINYIILICFNYYQCLSYIFRFYAITRYNFYFGIDINFCSTITILNMNMNGLMFFGIEIKANTKKLK